MLVYCDTIISVCVCVCQNVYAVLDLYGKVTAVSIVSSTLVEDMDSVKAPSLSSDSCSDGEEESTPVSQGFGTEHTLHHNCYILISVSFV